MHTTLLRGATVSLGAVAGAVLAVAFLPGGVAAADEDDFAWYPDNSLFNQTSQTTDIFGGLTTTGSGPLDGFISAFDPIAPLAHDELQANVLDTFIPSGLGPYDTFWTYDITAGDAVIPAGSVISLTDILDTFATETVESPGLGLFGLPEITETFFTPLGDFSF